MHGRTVLAFWGLECCCTMAERLPRGGSPRGYASPLSPLSPRAHRCTTAQAHTPLNHGLPTCLATTCFAVVEQRRLLSLASWTREWTANAQYWQEKSSKGPWFSPTLQTTPWSSAGAGEFRSNSVAACGLQRVVQASCHFIALYLQFAISLPKNSCQK